MKNNKIVIVHVFIDGMTFSKVADKYDSMPNIENWYYFYSPDKNFKFQKINDSRIIIIHDFDEYVCKFKDPVVDVILFYSLPYQYYYLFDYIDEHKYVVWWMWGYDIYNGQGQYPPLIPLKQMYKPLTKDFMENKIGAYKRPLYRRILRPFKRYLMFLIKMIRKIRGDEKLVPVLIEPQKTQEDILARIDAACSPLRVEFDLLKEHNPSFHAEWYQRPSSIQIVKPFKLKKEPGNVLVNHSLTYTVNHLDVFEKLYPLKLEEGRKYVMPVSYGIYGYNGNPEILIKASRFNKNQTIWLTKLLPLEEYRAIINSISHAVFGMIRQQGLGNIWLCISHGVKIYLYKDSVVYKELRKMGFVCYTIEDDLTTESLMSCLDENEAKNNYRLFNEYSKTQTADEWRAYLVDAIEKSNC